MLLVTGALIVAQPLGPKVQEKVTTQGNPGRLAVKQIVRYERSGPVLHRILTGDGMSPGTSAVWTCDKGGVRYEGLPGAEAGFIVTGVTRITEDGGEAKEISAGDGFLLPKGWTGTIEILEPTRKVFFLLAD